jgi:hypothetical protein
LNGWSGEGGGWLFGPVFLDVVEETGAGGVAAGAGAGAAGAGAAATGEPAASATMRTLPSVRMNPAALGRGTGLF